MNFYPFIPCFFDHLAMPVFSQVFPILCPLLPLHPVFLMLEAAVGFSTAGFVQGIAAGIGISTFLRAFFMMFLKSSSSDSLKKIPRNFLKLWSFGFSMAHFCFALRFDASTYLAILCRVLRSFVSSLVSTRTMKIRQVAFHSKNLIS